jgi:hypothetical protein
MPRGDAVHGVGVIRDLDRLARQLLPESYSARPAAQRHFGQGRDPGRQLRRASQPRPPQSLAGPRVDSRRDLATARVEDGKATAPAGELAEPPPQRIQGARPADR